MMLDKLLQVINQIIQFLNLQIFLNDVGWIHKANCALILNQGFIVVGLD